VLEEVTPLMERLSSEAAAVGDMPAHRAAQLQQTVVIQFALAAAGALLAGSRLTTCAPAVRGLVFSRESLLLHCGSWDTDHTDKHGSESDLCLSVLIRILILS